MSLQVTTNVEGKMEIFFFASGSLIFAVLLQILVWRIHVPKRQIRALSLVFASIFLADMFFLLVIWPTLYGAEVSRIQLSYFIVIFGLSTISYAISFTAVEGESPSFTILLRAEKCGSVGFMLEDCRTWIANHSFVENRVQGLLRDKLISMEGDRLVLTTKGKKMLIFFSFIRPIFGIRQVGG